MLETDYKRYVVKRVIEEPTEFYTFLRAGLEFVEEYLEYGMEPSVEELGDLIFWFTYISWIVCYSWTNPEEENNLTMGEAVLGVAGCIKRYYRDHNVHKLREIEEVYLPSVEFHLRMYCCCSHGKSFREVIEANIEKLDKRYGK